MEYTSKGVGNAALATGIIGTSLGALTGAGGLAGILGLGPRGPVGPMDPGDIAREEEIHRKHIKAIIDDMSKWVGESNG